MHACLDFMYKQHKRSKLYCMCTTCPWQLRIAYATHPRTRTCTVCVCTDWAVGEGEFLPILSRLSTWLCLQKMTEQH